jgi:hypothetical protein
MVKQRTLFALQPAELGSALLISVPASGDRDLSPISAHYNPIGTLQTPSM